MKDLQMGENNDSENNSVLKIVCTIKMTWTLDMVTMSASCRVGLRP